MPRPALLVLGLSLLVFSCAAQPQECRATLQADIVFMLDESGSVGVDNFGYMLDFVWNVANYFVIGPSNVQIGIGTFGEQVNTQLFMKDLTAPQTLYAAIYRISYSGGTTNTGDALAAVRTKFFTKDNGDRDTAPNYLIFLTDGQSVNSAATKAEVDKLAQTNITVFAIGIGDSFDLGELLLIASSPDLVFNVTDFLYLAAIQADVVQGLCGGQPATEPAQPQTMLGETTCTVTEMIMRNEIEFVRVGCDVLNVYPEPVCRFYRTTDGGEPVPLTSEPISYPTKNEGSVSYNSFVQVKVELTELGEGIHTFHAYCFPNVTDGQELVNVTSPAENVTLSFPRAVHSCPPSLAEDYLCGRPTSCNCSLVSPGRPKGSASWFYQAQFPRDDPVTLTYDENMPNIFYTCEGTSAMGRAYGSTLRVDIDTECV